MKRGKTMGPLLLQKKPPVSLLIKKRKDPGIKEIPLSFQSKLPNKIVKTTTNFTKPVEKVIKPKIIWKNLHKFNIKVKFIEIVNFLKIIAKKIVGFLKENSNILRFIEEKKEEYCFFFEKLRFLLKENKEKKAANSLYLSDLKRKEEIIMWGLIKITENLEF